MNDKTSFTSDEPVSGSQSDAIGKLIAQAGRRAAPTELAAQQVYRAVHEAWQVEQSRRVQKIWQRPAAIAATVLLAVVVGFWAWRWNADSTAAGVVAEVHGNVVLMDDSGKERLAAAGAILNRGEELRAASGSNILLQRSAGLTVLLGPNTHVKWETPDALRLLSGILYVDSGRSGQHDKLAVLTRAASIQHVGTQFSVDARGEQICVAVRAGIVAVNTPKGEARIVDGQEARIAENGELRRQHLTADAGPWTWLAANDPQFAIENRPLLDVVRDIADASGLRIKFATPELEQQAQQLILHGPALKVEPMVALDTVLLTTQMRATRDGDEIRITPQ